jgi:ribosomal protein S18 acetylase RimI-like enzyme
MSWDDLRGLGVAVAESHVDSGRFGVRVGRAVARWKELDQAYVATELTAGLHALRPDIAVARWPAHLTAVAGRLADSGTALVPADTLVYWSAPTAVVRANVPIPAWMSLASTPVGRGDVEAMVRATFADYPTHYSASALFDARRVLSGYVDWAGRLASDSPENCVTVLGDHDELMALATTQVVDDSHSLEVLLAGTAPAHRGQGVYRRLCAGVAARAAQLGCRDVVISTQASNIAVQRAWTSLGLRPFAAFTTVHARLAGEERDTSRS